MISLRLRIILIVGLVAGLILLLLMIRKRKLSLRYAIMWIAMIIALALMILIPGCLDAIAGLVGIYDVTNMVFFLGFVFSLMMSMALTVSASRNAERIKKLTQQVGIDDYEIRKSKGNPEQDKQIPAAEMKQEG